SILGDRSQHPFQIRVGHSFRYGSMPIPAHRRDQPGKIDTQELLRSTVPKELAQSRGQVTGIFGAAPKVFFEERLKLLRLQALEPFTLSVFSQSIKKSREQALVSTDGQLGNLALGSSVLEVAIQKPMVSFSDALGPLQRTDFSLGQKCKQVLE